VLLVTADTLRADRLGCYGGARAATPNVDALARDGVLFEQAVTPVPLTLPAHVSLFTGTVPARHGVTSNGGHRLREEATTLAEILRARGYATAAVVAAFPLDGRFGLAQGFDLYDDRLPPVGPVVNRARRGAEVTDRALGWIREKAREPWLLWLHYFDPHDPYEPPEPFAARYAGAPYEGEVAYLDSCLGPAFEAARAAGRKRGTLIVFTADHGEGLGDHGEPYHGLFLYDATVRIPLVLSLPGRLPAGTRVSSQVRLIDVLPTVLELCGGSAPPEAQGESLLGAIPVSADRPALLETQVPAQAFAAPPLVGLRAGRLKWIEGERPELFDLAADPAESRNLAGERPETVRQLRETLRRLLAACASRGLDAEPRDLRPEEVAALRSLGYAWVGAGSRPATAGPGKSHVEVFEGMRRARGLLDAGATGEARALLEELGEGAAWNPGLARLFLVLVERAGDPKQGVRWASRLRDLHPDSAPFWTDLAWALLRDARFEEARQAAVEAGRRDPGFLDAGAMEGTALLAMGRKEEAQSVFQRVVDGSADPGGAALRVAEFLLQAGERRLGEGWLRRALEVNPVPPRARNRLASLYAEEGRSDEALALLEEVLAADPADLEARALRAQALESRGESERARGEWEEILRRDPGNESARRRLGR
jgi:arylsulfatase A-like enzyme/Flp pilus assembly protein TadD